MSSESPYTPPELSPTTFRPEDVDKESRTLALAAHLVGLVGFIGPLIVWLIYKDKSPFVQDQAKESLNFQLTVLIGHLICGVLTCFFIGFFLFPVVLIGSIVYCILAGIKANEGIAYRYPFNIRFIS